MSDLRVRGVGDPQVFRGQHLFGRSHGEDTAGGHQHQPIAVLCGLVEIVQGGERADIALPGQILHALHQFHLMGGIEVGGRLVQEQQRGLLHQCARHQHPAMFAAGKAGDGPVGEREQIGLRQHLPHQREIGLGIAEPAPAMRIPAHEHDLAHGEIEGGRFLLRHKGDLAGQVQSAHAPDRLAIKQNPPLARRQGQRQDTQQRGFAAPVRPDQSDKFAGVEGDRDIGQNLFGAVTGMQGLCFHSHGPIIPCQRFIRQTKWWAEQHPPRVAPPGFPFRRWLPSTCVVSVRIGYPYAPRAGVTLL